MGAHLISIAGLQNLPNLQNFNADWNAFETLDFSGLTNLTNVDVSDCEELSSTGVKSINLTGCTSLQVIYMDDNDFSAGFPDLSSCTSLQYFDADQCMIEGSLDLSNLPALKGFDLGGNTTLTEVILSSEQLLGDGRNLNFSNCALTQTSVDNVLHAVASGSITGGSISIVGSNNALPSFETGLPAVRTILDKGWYVDKNSYHTTLQATGTYDTFQNAVNNLYAQIDIFTYINTTLTIGNYVYQDSDLRIPTTDGFLASNDGYVYEVSGGNGQIVSATQYGV